MTSITSCYVLCRCSEQLESAVVEWKYFEKYISFVFEAVPIKCLKIRKIGFYMNHTINHIIWSIYNMKYNLYPEFNWGCGKIVFCYISRIWIDDYWSYKVISRPADAFQTDFTRYVTTNFFIIRTPWMLWRRLLFKEFLLKLCLTHGNIPFCEIKKKYLLSYL